MRTEEIIQRYSYLTGYIDGLQTRVPEDKECHVSVFLVRLAKRGEANTFRIGRRYYCRVSNVYEATDVALWPNIRSEADCEHEIVRKLHETRALIREVYDIFFPVEEEDIGTPMPEEKFLAMLRS